MRRVSGRWWIPSMMNRIFCSGTGGADAGLRASQGADQGKRIINEGSLGSVFGTGMSRQILTCPAGLSDGDRKISDGKMGLLFQPLSVPNLPVLRRNPSR